MLNMELELLKWRIECGMETLEAYEYADLDKMVAQGATYIAHEIAHVLSLVKAINEHAGIK
jgi:hypothetical protein